MTGTVTRSDIAAMQAIKQRLAQHSRGLDRVDAALLADCYHEGATLDYGFFKGPASDFPAIYADAQFGQPVTMHRTNQMWIALDGDHAKSESYVLAYAQFADDDGVMKQRIICGRYLDRHAWRDGAWRITNRDYVLDSNCNWTGAWHPQAPSPIEEYLPVGAQGAADPGMALLALAVARNRQDDTGGKGMSKDAPTQAAPDQAAIDAIVSKQQIADLTMAYCRAVDRADETLLRSIFHDDSVVVSGTFNGNGQQFATEICGIVRAAFDQTFHSIANQWIEVTGDSAVAETYVIAIATMTDMQEGKSEMLSGGRYIDRFTRREGVWKFAERTFVSDWNRIDQTTRDMDKGLYGAFDLKGKQGPDDPVYAMWN